MIIFIDDGAPPSVGNTVALLHMDGPNGATTFVDDTGKTWAAFGNAQISTTDPRFGTGCGLFDGAGDYLASANEPDFGFGTGDFCFEIFLDPGAFSGVNYTLFSIDNRWVFYYNNFRGMFVFDAVRGINVLNTPDSTVITTGYTHAFWQRVSGVMTLGYNGVVYGGFSSTDNFGTSQIVNIARDMRGGGNFFMNGRFDEARISRIGRYSGPTYIVPAGPFTLD